MMELVIENYAEDISEAEEWFKEYPDKKIECRRRRFVKNIEEAKKFFGDEL